MCISSTGIRIYINPIDKDYACVAIAVIVALVPRAAARIHRLATICGRTFILGIWHAISISIFVSLVPRAAARIHRLADTRVGTCVCSIIHRPVGIWIAVSITI
jgi:hypothetical protein